MKFCMIVCIMLIAPSAMAQFGGFKIPGVPKPVSDVIIMDAIMNDDADDAPQEPKEPKYGRNDVPNLKRMKGYPGYGVIPVKPEIPWFWICIIIGSGIAFSILIGWLGNKLNSDGYN